MKDWFRKEEVSDTGSSQVVDDESIDYESFNKTAERCSHEDWLYGIIEYRE